MDTWMPWIMNLGLLAGLVTAVVMLARLADRLATKLGELSTRKPFYVLEVEGGKRGVRKVIRLEPAMEVEDEGVVPLEETAVNTLQDMDSEPEDPDIQDVGPRV